MSNLADIWFARRHQELLREANRERLARELRPARKARAGEARASKIGDRKRTERMTTEVRRGLAKDAPLIAELLLLNAMPRWVAYEERFIVAEKDGVLVAALRFQEDFERLHLGLLITAPWAEERTLAAALYAGALAMARGLGLREIQARTSRHRALLRAAGYHRWRNRWRLDLEDPGTPRVP